MDPVKLILDLILRQAGQIVKIKHELLVKKQFGLNQSGLSLVRAV
jgi:hypothetical protein